MGVFSKVQLEKYADAMIWGLTTARRVPFKKYENIMIRCDLEARELGEIIYRKLVQRRYNVVFQFLPTPGLERGFYEFSDARQRGFLGDWDKALYEGLNGYVFINAPSSLTHLKDIDPKRQGEAAKAKKPLWNIRNKREENGKFA